MVFLPYRSLKPLSTCIANRDVWEEVVVIVRNERISDQFPEWMVGLGSEDVVAQSTSAAVADPCGVVQEGSEVFETALDIC